MRFSLNESYHSVADVIAAIQRGDCGRMAQRAYLTPGSALQRLSQPEVIDQMQRWLEARQMLPIQLYGDRDYARHFVLESRNSDLLLYLTGTPFAEALQASPPDGAQPPFQLGAASDTQFLAVLTTGRCQGQRVQREYEQSVNPLPPLLPPMSGDFSLAALAGEAVERLQGMLKRVSGGGGRQG